MCCFQVKDVFSRDYSTGHKLLLLLFQRCFGKKIFDCLCTIGLGQQSHSKRETEGKLVERNIGTVRHVDQTNRGNKQKHCLPFIALF